MENEPCLPGGKKPAPLRMVSGPDGLEAWCVALAACFINFVMAGLGRMSGILYVAFIEIFQVDRGQAAIPFSVRSSMRNLLGPVVGILGQKYSVRTVTLIGGVLGTLSAACCFYAEDITWVTVIWGGINGVATSLTTTLPQVVIGQYFVKYRTTAAGMAFSGGCVGSFLFPAVLEHLLLTYGLSGTFLIIAGIIMHVIPAAMMLRSPSWLRHPRTDHLEIATVDKKVEGQGTMQEAEPTIDDPDKNGSKCNYCESKIDVDEYPNVGFLKANADLVLKLIEHLGEGPEIGKYDAPSEASLQEGLEAMYCLVERQKNGTETICASSTDDRTDSAKCLEKSPEVVHQSGCDNDKQFYVYLHLTKLLGKCHEKQPNGVLEESMNLENKSESITKELRKVCNFYEHISTHEVSPDQRTKFPNSDFDAKSQELSNSDLTKEGSEPSNTFIEHIKVAFRLHANPLFLLICMCRACHFLTFVPAVTTIVDFGIDKGLTKEDGKFVIAALSMGDLIGRLGLGWVTDNSYISLPRYMLIVMVLQGISTGSLPFSSVNTPMLYAAITLFGLLQGSLFVRHPVLVSRYMDKNEQSIAMGCMNFSSGFLGFALPAYIGYFRDVVGSYDGMFFINGAIGFCGGLLWTFEPYFLRCLAKKDQQLKNKCLV